MTALQYAKKICYSSEQTLMFTYEMAKKYANSPGCYVECGVAAGGQIIAMVHGAPEKTVWAFDSFEGIPLPSNKDNQMPGIKVLTKEEQKALPKPGQQKLESTGMTAYSVGQFWGNIQKSGVKPTNIIVAKGWFEEVLPTADPGEIAILRLDGDLYNSTLVCLQYLFSKVIEGGIVIIDDWYLPGCRQAVKDYFKSNIPYPVIETDNIAYFIKS